MTSQAIRKLLVVVTMITLAALGAEFAYADHSTDVRKVDMKFAGTLLLNLEQQQTLFGEPNGLTDFIGVARAKAKGNLGWADVSVAAKSVPVQPVPDARCPARFFKVADITDNNIVLTFADLALLYGDGGGVVCVEFDASFMPIDQFISIDGIWMGGTGRFANAEGEFSIITDTIMEISPNTQFSAESGRITGFLGRR